MTSSDDPAGDRLAAAPTGRITSSTVDGVATLVIDNVGKHNAVTSPMWDQLGAVLDELKERDDLRLLVVRGAGGVFSSGADLNEVLAATQGREAATRFCTRVATALLSLVRFPSPTLAVLERHVAGGGAEIALACDLRVARDDVTFQIPMARLGVVPDHVTARRLAQVAGPATARSVLLQGRSFDAHECLRRGLVEDVLPPEAVDEHLARTAQTFRSLSAYSVTRTKAVLLGHEAWDEMDLVDEMVASFVHGDVAANARAFLRQRADRRAPTS